jgi:hypothetical protein
LSVTGYRKVFDWILDQQGVERQVRDVLSSELAQTLAVVKMTRLAVILDDALAIRPGFRGLLQNMRIGNKPNPTQNLCLNEAAQAWQAKMLQSLGMGQKLAQRLTASSGPLSSEALKKAVTGQVRPQQWAPVGRWRGGPLLEELLPLTPGEAAARLRREVPRPVAAVPTVLPIRT